MGETPRRVAIAASVRALVRATLVGPYSLTFDDVKLYYCVCTTSTYPAFRPISSCLNHYVLAWNTDGLQMGRHRVFTG